MTARKTALHCKMANFSDSVFATTLEPEGEQYRVGKLFTPSVDPTTSGGLLLTSEEIDRNPLRTWLRSNPDTVP